MKIGIDARFLTHPQPGGFKTYTTNLVATLAEIGCDDEFVLYLDRPADPLLTLPTGANFSYRVVPGEAPMVGMIWREQVSLARQAAQDRLDLFHSPCLTAPLNLSCPSVVTIHDTIWRFPRLYAKRQAFSAKRQMMEWYYRYVPELAVKKAALVLTVSKAAGESIRQHLGVPDGRIQVTYEAAGSIYHRIDDPQRLQAIRQKYRLERDFILTIGSADPRKNITTLIQAYGMLPAGLREQYSLAIVWNHALLVAEMAKTVADLGLAGQVHFIQGVSDDDLVGLYNAAALFVFPSRYEGFGLPLLEAMSCGVPVIAAQNSSIPEVTGDAAILVQAEDAPGMAAAIGRVLQDPALGQRLSAEGLLRAKEFSWTSCGAETLSAYHQAVHLKGKS